MKRLLFVLLVLWSLEGWGQRLVWERRFSWVGIDQLTDVVSLGDGTFLATGFAAYSNQTALVKFDDQGDTLFASWIPLYVGYNQKYNICRTALGQIYVSAIQVTPGRADRTRLVRIGKDGSTYWFEDLPFLDSSRICFGVNHMIEGPNGTLILAGFARDPRHQATEIGYVACYDTNGIFIWDNEIREHPDLTLCNHVELTAQGDVFVSGTAGSRIWGAELNASNGAEIRRATFYQTPSLNYFDYEKSWIYQAPNNLYLVSGVIDNLTANERTYLGMHQGWAGPKIWGFERNGFMRAAQVNEDGSIVYLKISQASTIWRIRADSSTQWVATLPLASNQWNSYPISYAPLLDTSVVAVGTSWFRDFTNVDWYIARISNFGIPYNPAQVTNTAKPKAAAPHPYPNPCRQSLGFAGLASRAQARLYDGQGRMVLEATVAEGTMLNIEALPPGLYRYAAEVGGKAFSGRVVKE